jgi:GGDEF domain-containing protein
MDVIDPGTPAVRLARAARGAQDLCEALWASMHTELDGGARADPRRVTELSQRLADVCSTIALLACAGPDSLEPPEPSPEARIEIHDARHEEGPSAWIGSIGRRLERYREDRLPFAVVLIEVLGLDQLVHAEPAQEISRLISLVERALGGELRPADLLTQETRGRYWLVTPETDMPGARTLAERLARTVRASALHRGVGLEVAIGIAICPDDGLDASVLAAHADVGVYAARASGRPVAPADDPAA